MWFRNLQIYRLPAPWAMDKATLSAQLLRGLFQRCPDNQMASRGWVPPQEHGDLVHVVGGHWLLCLAVEQRLLPAETVNRTVRELADQAAAQQGYPVGRKGLRELRERVIAELLPQAFTRVRRTFVWIDPVNGWLGIDAGACAGVAPVIEHLCHCLGDFLPQPLHTQRSPQAAMADWLAAGEGPTAFSIDRDCELKGCGAEKAAVRYVNQPLTDDDIAAEIKAHLAAGQLPTRLALTWDDRLSFVLTERLEIKRLAFILDMIPEATDRETESADEQFDTDFALMTSEFVRFLPALVSVLGGEEA